MNAESLSPLPEEERSQKESFPALVGRLSRLSVHKHFDAYEDVAWDAPEMQIVPGDPRFEVSTDVGLGQTAWYRAQPPEIRSAIGLHMTANSMKVGLQFENVLSRGLLTWALEQPNGAPEFRYVYHEVIEESQHSLMFQEFVNRAGVDARPLGGWRARAADHVVMLGRRFPELFFLFVLGGEDPIDHVQRTVLASGREIHPLLRRISQIHITEEARHLCFARQYLRERVPSLPRGKQLLLSVAAPVILHLMVKAMLQPSAALIAKFEIPDAVVREAWTENPRHREACVASLSKVRNLCEELEIVTPRTMPLWRRLGIA
jgi:hypothetical protein